MAERRCLVRLGASALLVCCLGCKQDADSQLQKSARSWRGSIELAQAEEKKHNVSAKYVKQVGELASKSLSKELNKPDIKPETRREAEAVVALANEASK